MEKLLAL